ncbi:MAG TPA: crossover junction endodeoxyribonuclease RuvC [Patescibacteria group bacterium]|nr:crossover junction endodeoxyribonuclease RuvC [Patescibacteria group bacterium]
MKILGLDPGFERLGWAVVEKDAHKFSLLTADVIHTPKTENIPSRLLLLGTALEKVLQEFNPQFAIIESLFFATNAKTAINVAQARGVIVYLCMKNGIEVIEKTPLQIKSAVTGDGHADKKAIEKMVRLQIKDIPSTLLDDAIDAIAAALSI